MTGGLGPIPADVLAQCYGEMRLMARRILSGNAMMRVLQPTELANEAAIRLIRTKLLDAKDQGHLLAVAARMMRQVMIDEARKLASAKRHAPLLMTLWPGAKPDDALIDMADLEAGLAALTLLSPIRAEIVELRFMLGMTVSETAVAVKLSDRTVNRHWIEARAWLLDHIMARVDARPN